MAADSGVYRLLAVAALAGATLLLESTLLRLLAVAQFYHFAFLVVSLALLGFGASGTLLTVSRRLQEMALDSLLAWAGAGFGMCTALAYLAVNWLPFDSYSIAWEEIQILYFVLFYLALALPFLCSGIGIGAALAASRQRSHQVYAANLIGSAAGALLALLFLRLAGVPGAMLAAGWLGLLPALGFRLRRAAAMLLSGGLVVFALLTSWNVGGNGPLLLSISPYKGYAYARLYPTAQPIFGRWNAISRVDVLADAGTRLLPGLSYTFPGNPPPQHALAVDAGGTQPISLVGPEEFTAAAFLPEAVAFALRPAARVLLLEPGGGLGVLQALAGDAAQVTAVVSNPLTRLAVEHSAGRYDIYAHPRVEVALESPRVFTRRRAEKYDIVFLPLTDAYRPVTSGAYSLAESYDLTVEAFVDALARLGPDGLLVTTRWLQTPPSESLRLAATLIQALEETGVAEPAEALALYRGVQTITALVQPDGWQAEELARLRAFTQERRFDLVWLPDLQAAETNRYNRLPEPVYFNDVRELLATANRESYYAAYPFAIRPATDDRPFFFHFFTWAQTPQILASLGRTWQPFGGSGYFVLLAFLALALLLSGGLILLPLLLARGVHPQGAGPRGRVLLYFALLGLAFLFVEIPLIQRWILLLGHPAYAFTAVVVTLLLFSGIGSLLARERWLPGKVALALLAVMALLTPFAQERLIGASLGLPFGLRLLLAGLGLAPLGFLMGLPFPLGLAWLEAGEPALVPWAWAINGCASVIASVLAAIVGLGSGFSAVLLLGAAAYAAAWGVYATRARGERNPASPAS
ncbi:MAG: hypothetical protein HY328_00685 [Chloroflexi bacterium]|nr:hypothetical protein [Chloroflexota bacterium]